MLHDLISCSLIHNFSVLHNNKLISHIGCYANVMGNNDDTGSEIITKLHHLAYDLCLCGNIQRTGRLICKKQLRVKSHGHGNTNSLAHTTGKLVRITFHDIFRVRKTHFLKHGASLLPCFCFGYICMCTDIFHILTSDLTDRVQSSAAVLEDHGNAGTP